MKIPIILLVTLVFLFPKITSGSSVNGTIDSNFPYAWSKDFGWLNFATDQGDIHVTDTGLTGYIWSKNNGWINLAPLNSGQQVKNDGEGHLSGFAWGQVNGWFEFSGITIDVNGLFHGTSTNIFGESFTFNCDQCNVKTDWRPISVRPIASAIITNGNNNSGGGWSSVSIAPIPESPATPTSTPVISVILPLSSTIPSLPNTGFPPHEKNIFRDIIVLVGICIFSIGFFYKFCIK